MNQELKKLFRNAKTVTLFAKERLTLELHVKKLLMGERKGVVPVAKAVSPARRSRDPKLSRK
ncbi:hypothetical protein KW797_00395 [Candidatus Parcubacteria bacterium]|nr:hypothetical protein [Candidatus Parcubacteria bacterium]